MERVVPGDGLPTPSLTETADGFRSTFNTTFPPGRGRWSQSLQTTAEGFHTDGITGSSLDAGGQAHEEFRSGPSQYVSPMRETMPCLLSQRDAEQWHSALRSFRPLKDGSRDQLSVLISPTEVVPNTHIVPASRQNVEINATYSTNSAPLPLAPPSLASELAAALRMQAWWRGTRLRRHLRTGHDKHRERQHLAGVQWLASRERLAILVGRAWRRHRLLHTSKRLRARRQARQAPVESDLAATRIQRAWRQHWKKKYARRRREVMCSFELDRSSKHPSIPAFTSLELIAKIETLFRKFDRDGDGKVVLEEAVKGFTKYAHVSTRAMFSEVDEDGNGVITMGEFKRFWAQVSASGYADNDLLLDLDELLQGNAWVDYADTREVKNEVAVAKTDLCRVFLEKVEALFNKIDVNGDHTISREESKKSFNKFSALFSDIDENGSSSITLEEFTSFWRQIRDSGNQEEELLDDLDELLQGNLWIDNEYKRDIKETVSNMQGARSFLEKVEDLFAKIDASGDGNITREEAKMAFRKFPEVSARAMFSEVDEDGDGIITLEEFKAFWTQVRNSGYDEEELIDDLDELLQGNVWVDYDDSRGVNNDERDAKEALLDPQDIQLKEKVDALFNAMDSSGDGNITRHEAKKSFKKFGEVSARAMFSEVDEDGDGVISLEEFRDFWMQVKKSGYAHEDLLAELDELLEGNVWVDYADNRDVQVESGDVLASNVFLQKVEELFTKIDANGDGTVSREEARKSFRKFSEVSTRAMFSEVDQDGSDGITLKEFKSFWVQVRSCGYEEDDLIHDIDELLMGNVWVNYEDARDVHNNHKENFEDKAESTEKLVFAAQVEALFNKMDLDGDGKITRDTAKKTLSKYVKVGERSMFNELGEHGGADITSADFRRCWAQVRHSGYSDGELTDDLDKLLDGRVWVDYDDTWNIQEKIPDDTWSVSTPSSEINEEILEASSDEDGLSPKRKGLFPDKASVSSKGRSPFKASPLRRRLRPTPKACNMGQTMPDMEGRLQSLSCPVQGVVIGGDGAACVTRPSWFESPDRLVGLGKPCFGPLYGTFRAPMDLQKAKDHLKPQPQRRRRPEEEELVTLVSLPQLKLPPRYALTKTGKRAQCHLNCTLPVFSAR